MLDLTGRLIAGGVDADWLLNRATLPQVLVLAPTLERLENQRKADKGDTLTLAVLAAFGEDAARQQQAMHRKLRGEEE